MTTAVIVQARLGSKRFPRKVLADLNGKPVLWHVLTRARKIKADYYVLAIPESDRKALTPLAEELGWLVWYEDGPEDDVLARYYNAARCVAADVIVRITGDCPLISPDECNRVASIVQQGMEQFYSNANPRRVVKGLDCEAFTFELLSDAHNIARNPSDREHVTRWMHKALAVGPPNYSIDTPEDLERVRTAMAKRQAA